MGRRLSLLVVDWATMLWSGSVRVGTVGTGGRGGAKADEGDWLSFTSVMTAFGTAVAVLLGSVLTAQAVVSGDLLATFVRFALSITIGVYYVYLNQLARGKRPFSG